MFPSPEQPQRFLPEKPWPRYAFVPGRGLPHPVTDPGGHSFGAQAVIASIDPARWRECVPYLWGTDLFNFGYYWEAHEAWEGIWRAYDRSETPALFLQGLIKLAAAGVKVREGVPQGVEGLASGAAEHFREVAARADGGATYCGLAVCELDTAARRIQSAAAKFVSDAETSPRIVFDFVLQPGGSRS